MWPTGDPLNPWDKRDIEMTRRVPRPLGNRERLDPLTPGHRHQLGLQQTPQTPVSSDPETSRRMQSTCSLHLGHHPGNKHGGGQKIWYGSICNDWEGLCVCVCVPCFSEGSSWVRPNHWGTMTFYFFCWTALHPALPHTHTHTHTHTCTHIYKHTWACTHMHMQAHKCTHTHIP